MKRASGFLAIICVLTLCCVLVSCSDSSGSMTDDIFDFTLKINDDTYTIPEDISTFTDNGWTFPEGFDELDATVSHGGLKSTYLSQEDNWFNIEIFNNSGSDATLKDCPVGRLTYNFEGDLEIYTAGNYLLNGKTLDEVIAKYGEPLSQAEYSTYTEIIYDKDPTTSIYDRYTFRFDNETNEVKYIDVTNFN